MSKTDLVFVGTVTDIENPATEKADDGAGTSRYRFHVDEALSGLDKTEIDIYSGRGGADCSYHFRKGAQYLVFPYGGDPGKFWATICSDTRPVSEAKALLPELRAMRDGKKVASLYGVLYRTQQPYAATEVENYNQPLGNTRVQLRAEDKLFETTTDGDGRYSFYDLPAGTYQFGATLPPNLELVQSILSDPLPPLQLPASACYEYDLEALPTGRIRGQVLGPDGKRVACAPVELFLADRYKEGDRGWWEIQCEQDWFKFNNVSPGAYILVFNNSNRISPETPFGRTFFPGSPVLADAKQIHVNDGEQLLDTNIHVAEGRPIRELTVKLIAPEGTIPNTRYVLRVGSDGSWPSSKEVAPGVFIVPLLRGVSYVLYGEGSCSANGKYPKTDSRQVDGSDDATTEIVLTFPGKPCS